MISTKGPNGGFALGTLDAGSTGNTDTQLLVSGKYDEGVNDGSAEGTYKVKIEGYQSNGNKVYPLAMVDDQGNMDFYIENKNSLNPYPKMYFDVKNGRRTLEEVKMSFDKYCKIFP